MPTPSKSSWGDCPHDGMNHDIARMNEGERRMDEETLAAALRMP